jgi:hypothetical protein
MWRHTTRKVHKYYTRLVGPYEGRVVSMTHTVQQLAVFCLQYFSSTSCVSKRQQWRHHRCVPYFTEVAAMWGTFVAVHVGNYNRNWRYDSNHCWSQQKINASSQFHAPATLPQRKETPLPTESWYCVYTRGCLDHLAVRNTSRPVGKQTFMFRASSQVQIFHTWWKSDLTFWHPSFTFKF